MRDCGLSGGPRARPSRWDVRKTHHHRPVAHDEPPKSRIACINGRNTSKNAPKNASKNASKNALKNAPKNASKNAPTNRYCRPCIVVAACRHSVCGTMQWYDLKCCFSIREMGKHCSCLSKKTAQGKLRC